MNGINFPDPAVIRVADGWHAFATNARYNGNLMHVQMAHSPDFNTWAYRAGVDGMPQLASWIDPDSPRVWAPDVVQLADGTFMMYYTAAWKRKPNIHCVSYATSRNVDGPYTDPNRDSPWICPDAQGGAIDPAGYLNSDGTRWVVYKIRGNSLGHGGACGNTVGPIMSTPLMLQQVSSADGHIKIGSPVELVTNGVGDGPVVEAPSLTYLNGKYVLFFSSNCFASLFYDVSYAIASDIRGPYRKAGPLFVTGDMGMAAPGGLDIAVNGNHALWHGYVTHEAPEECIAKHRRFGKNSTDECVRNFNTGRAAFTGILSLDGNVVSVSHVS
ncbi:hypothetical protein LTR62_000990 [Meristemomyces frigidus]|uniref:Glycoside hydrolase family 43 protein n=1 Tax=Meristemomyces frigidus TaxID=1508187 RepID=A0AAN7YMM7_9PEZI|nr:hypothetical protein LTR62_000990 [Meristemomyces frigidus]